MNIPQVIVTLGPKGDLIAELPGTMATRRQVPLPKGAVEGILLRILQAQAEEAKGNARGGIGHQAAPTQAQVRDWAGVIRRMEEGSSGRTLNATQNAEVLGL